VNDVRTTDVVVVGGGVYGCAVAYELAGDGLDVTLLERDVIASGASGGVGLRGVRATGRDLRELPLMREATARWPGLAEELGGHTGFAQVGCLQLFDRRTRETPAAMDALRARVSVQNDFGVQTELIDRDRVLELEPGVSAEVAGAVYTPLDGVADHTATTRAFADAARGRGATIVEGAAVRAVRGLARGAEVVTAADDEYVASHAVVILANHRALDLLAFSFGMQLPVWPYNPQATTVRSRNGFTMNGLVNHLTRPFSAKAIADDLVMLTGNSGGRWNRASDHGETDPSITRASLTDAPELFPAMADSEVVDVDASRADSASIDDIPFIDRVPRAADVWFGLGWSGHGFAIAPAVSHRLAQWVRTGSRPEVLAPFGIDRLGP
jgi:sarcosine oxidase, subunit beta